MSKSDSFGEVQAKGLIKRDKEQDHGKSQMAIGGGMKFTILLKREDDVTTPAVIGQIECRPIHPTAGTDTHAVHRLTNNQSQTTNN